MDPLSNSLNSQISLGQLGNVLSSKSKSKAESTENKSESGDMLNSFGSMLQQQMSQINQLQSEADKAVETYALGGDIELHNVVMATDKAEMALQFASQIRNKVINAYQEITKMNI